MELKKINNYNDYYISNDDVVYFNKECGKCGEVKPRGEFYKRKSSNDGRQSKCKKCFKVYYQANKYKINARDKIYRETNKDKKKAYQKAYYQSNKDKIKEYNRSNQKVYYQANKDKKKAYIRNKIKTDPLFRLRRNIRRRTTSGIKRKGYTKKSRTYEILGIDYDGLVIYLQRQFKKGMNWDNYGEWHIDHIIPLSIAKTEKELLKLCHYTNLQPLWAVDNLTKSNKIEETQILLRI